MPIPGLDERFISGADLSQYLVDKDTGAPLAGGKIYFYRDTQRLTPKLVYTLSGNPGAYEYVELPNPITLSSVGTIQDEIGNNVPLYYYPYDSNNELDLYYIVVEDYMGVRQFDRQAWPTISGSQNPLNDTSTQPNQIINPQFTDFDGRGADYIVLPVTGSGESQTLIAPGWQILAEHTGAGSVTISRNAVAGLTDYDTNPPFTLTVAPQGAITRLRIFQPSLRTPALFADDHVCTGVLLGPGSGLEVKWQDSDGNTVVLLSASNTGATYSYFNDIATLPISVSPDTGLNGYVNFVLELSTTSTTTFGSVQIVSTYEDEFVAYFQESGFVMDSKIMGFYKQPLLTRPMPSYLVGWDFPTNPAQILGRTVPPGSPEAYYVWDQTILYQTSPSSFTVTEADDGSIRIVNTSGSTAQFALVQYLSKEEAREILSQDFLSVQVKGGSTLDDAPIMAVGLFYSTVAPLAPMLPNTLIGSLNSAGQVATLDGDWFNVPRDGQRQMVGILTGGIGGSAHSVLSFNYWAPSEDPMAKDLVTYFAIVVGVQEVAPTESFEFNYISLVPGIVGAPPVYKTAQQTLKDCQYYYQKSYEAETVPGTPATYDGMLTSPQICNTNVPVLPGGFRSPMKISFTINFATTMRNFPALEIYSPVTGTFGNVSYNYMDLTFNPTATELPISNWDTTGPLGGLSPSRITFGALGFIPSLATSSTAEAACINYHFVADCRLGEV